MIKFDVDTIKQDNAVVELKALAVLPGRDISGGQIMQVEAWRRTRVVIFTSPDIFPARGCFKIGRVTRRMVM